MKLKLDLHPIYSDTAKIEQALNLIIADAMEKRASEVEIIPGKGSGALKKTVLRFLERPEIKKCYHRIEKDSENWGRLFVHFRHESPSQKQKSESDEVMVEVACPICQDKFGQSVDSQLPETSIERDCPSCGTPLKLKGRKDRRARIWMETELNY